MVCVAADEPEDGEGHGAALARDQQHPLVAQGEEVGTLPDVAGGSGLAGQQRAQVLPVAEIGRAVEEDGAADVDDAGGEQHVPRISLAPDKRIAKIVRRPRHGRDLAEDGVAGELLPGEQVIAAGGQALRLHVVALAAHAGVDDCRHAAVVNHAAGKAAALVRSPRRRREGDGQVGPVDEIVTDGVPPVDAAPEGAFWVVLVKEMLPATPGDHAVGVVHPVGRRQEMVDRPVGVPGELLALRYSIGFRMDQSLILSGRPRRCRRCASPGRRSKR